MRIGVDGSCWANDRGYGRYVRELLSAMVALAPRDEFIFFLDPASEARFALREANVQVVRVEQSLAPTDAAAADGSRSPLDMLRFTRAVWRSEMDVFFAPTVYSYYPLPPGRKIVVGIQDAIAERFASRTLPTPRARLFWAMKVRLALSQSALVLTISDYAARDLERVMGIPRSKLRVAVIAPADAFRPSPDPEAIQAAAARAGLPERARWITYVGGFSPHKNVDVLVRAFGRATEGQGGEHVYLALAGKMSGDAFLSCVPAIQQAIAATETQERVLWLGYVPDDDVRHLHSGAVAVALPSDCEGFGLPAVEAAACGAPVVATTESPLPELLAGGGIFVEPRDEDALADALRTMLTDELGRRRMAAAALDAARTLSWRRCAEEALVALRDAAAS